MPCSASERTFAIVVSVIVFCLPVQAVGQTVDRIESIRFCPGQTASLTAYGKGLAAASHLWTPFGRFDRQAVGEKNKDLLATFEGHVPDDVIPGVYETRVITTAGVSDVQFLVVDDLPSFRPPDPAELNPPAFTIPNSCCINGLVNPLKKKVFGLELDKGQMISVEVFGRRLDSPMDPVLRLCDSDGNELMFADDITGLSGDAQMTFTAPTTGRYVLELWDVKFAGGGNYVFHLRVGSFPLVQGTLPRRTAPSSVSLVANGQDDQSVGVPENAASEQSVRQVAAAGANGSALVSVIPIPESPVLEVEPNNTRDSATRVNGSHAAIAGRIHAADDVDWFRVTGKRGDHLCVTAHTRDVGSPADLVLDIYDVDGKKLQSSDDTGQLDAQLSIRLSRTDDYFLCVKELSQQGGEVWTYDLELDFAGRLEVSLETDRHGVPRGATGAIPVKVKRFGVSEPFQLSFVETPDGIDSQPVFVSSRQNTAFVTIQNGDRGSSPFCERLQLQATLASGVRVPVVFRPAATKTPDHRLLRHQIGVFVFSAKAPGYYLSTGVSEISMQAESESKIALTATRSKNWTYPIDIASAIPAKEIPKGISIEAIKITDAVGELTVKTGADVEPGDYSISLSGTSKKGKAVVVQPVPTIHLIVLPPALPE